MRLLVPVSSHRVLAVHRRRVIRFVQLVPVSVVSLMCVGAGAGAEWGPALTPAGSGRGSHAALSADVNDRGDLVVASTRDGFPIARLRDGASGRWGPVVRVSTSTRVIGSPVAVINPKGDVLVVWRSPGQLNSARRGGDGVWKRQRVAVIPAAAGLRPVQAGLSTTGLATVSWQDERVLGASAALPGGRWTSFPTLRTPSDRGSLPALAVSDAGDVVAAWHRPVGGRADAFLAVVVGHALTRRWEVPHEVARMPSGVGLVAAIGPTGCAAVAWKALDDAALFVAVRQSLSAGWSRPESPRSDANGFPSGLAVDAGGNVAAAWPSFTGDDAVTLNLGVRDAGGSWRATVLAQGHFSNTGPVWMSSSHVAVVVAIENPGYPQGENPFVQIRILDRQARTWSVVNYPPPDPDSGKGTIAIAPNLSMVRVPRWLRIRALTL